MSFDFSLPDICIHGSTVFARKPAELGLIQKAQNNNLKILLNSIFWAELYEIFCSLFSSSGTQIKNCIFSAKRPFKLKGNSESAI